MIAGITLSIIAIQTNQVLGAVIVLTLVGGTPGSRNLLLIGESLAGGAAELRPITGDRDASQGECGEDKGFHWLGL